MHIIFLQNRQRSNQNRPKNYQIFFRTINFNFTHVQNSDNTIHPDLQATKILINKIFLPEQIEGNFFFLAKNHLIGSSNRWYWIKTNTKHQTIKGFKDINNPKKIQLILCCQLEINKAQLHYLFRRCDVHKKAYKRELFFNRYINLKTAIAINKFY